MLNRILLLFVIFIVTNSCTRDDICADGTATTPMLIITFNNIDTPTTRKSVVGLKVTVIGTASQTFAPNATNDSIAIPLNPNSGQLKYYFSRDFGGPTGNIDEVTFTYTPYSVYVNRACGYKINYSGLEGTIEAGNGENWIQSIDIKIPTVENENKAHITILH